MQPDDTYKKLQKELLYLTSINDRTGETTKIRSQLERQFKAAWKLGPDRLRLGAKLEQAIRRFTPKGKKWVHGFDHCTCYTGENDQRVIVTQPYNVSVSEIAQDLTLDNGICPEVINATEWGFHNPGQAKLFIVKFPFGFREAMDNFEKNLRRAEIEEVLKEKWEREKSEPTDFETCDMA